MTDIINIKTREKTAVSNVVPLPEVVSDTMTDAMRVAELSLIALDKLMTAIRFGQAVVGPTNFPELLSRALLAVKTEDRLET